MTLENKTVWITGASSGLGEALAVEAARQGANIILSARNIDKLEAVRQRLPRPAMHTILPLDLTDNSQLHQSVDKAGAVDILINNGGISQRSLAVETDQQVVRKIMETNFFGHIELSRLILPQMLTRQSGIIVTMSSVVGYFGTPLRSTYSASKHALHGYFDSMRYEVEKQGVQVTIICPGFIRTNISLNAVTADGSQQGRMDDGQENGMSPEAFAIKAWKGILAGKSELHIGGSELAGIYLKRFVPRIFDSIIRRRKVT